MKCQNFQLLFFHYFLVFYLFISAATDPTLHGSRTFRGDLSQTVVSFSVRYLSFLGFYRQGSGQMMVGHVAHGQSPTPSNMGHVRDIGHQVSESDAQSQFVLKRRLRYVFVF